MDFERLLHLRNELKSNGTIVLDVDDGFLSRDAFEKLGDLSDQLSQEFVETGDAGEPNHVMVGRFMTDVERPELVNRPLSDQALEIVTDEKVMSSARAILGVDEVCVRRMQVNTLTEGSFVGLHLDTDSNPDYLVAVVLQYGQDYEGGEFVVYDETGQMTRRLKTDYGTITISDCRFSHEVKKVTRGERVSLVYFLSQHKGDNRRSEVERAAY